MADKAGAVGLDPKLSLTAEFIRRLYVSGLPPHHNNKDCIPVMKWSRSIHKQP